MTEPDTIQLDYSGPVLRGPKRRRWSRWRTRGPMWEVAGLAVDVVGWTGGALLLVVVPIMVLFGMTGPVLGFPTVVLVVLMVPLLAAAAQAVRRRRATAVLGYLEQAVRLNLPLDRMLAAAARGEVGKTRRRLEDLYLAVQGGTSLADAVAVAVPEMPPRAVGLVAYGESTGQLAITLRRLLDDGRRRGGDQTAEDRAFAAWYPPLVLLIGLGAVGLIGVFILPKFMQIFRDFRIDLPPLTRGLVYVFERVEWTLYLIPLVLLGALAVLGNRLHQAMRGDTNPSWLLQGPLDRLRWYLPVLGQPYRDRALSDLCDALADAVEQGFPLADAVGRAQRLGSNRVLMRRVAAWAAALDGGMDAATAARAAGLPRLIAGLVVASNPADAGGGLRFAARFYAARRVARRAVLAAAYTPAVTLLLGLLVAIVALALMLPMRDLINRSGPYPVGL